MPMLNDCSFVNSMIGLGGVFVGGLIGFFSARHVSELNARRQAGTALRAAFAQEIAKVRLAHSGDRSIDVERTLSDAFPKHAAAVEEYRFFVKSHNRAAYERAWRSYYEIGGSVRFFDYYMGDTASELFSKRVRAILKFTEP